MFEFMKIKREQLVIERENNILLKLMNQRLREILSFMELSISKGR